jgi:DNA topoisomerase VI subunit B
MKTKIDKIRGIGRKAEFIIETDSTHEIEKITVKSTDEKNKPITVEFSKKKEENEGKTGSKITQELARYPCHYCGMLFDDYERRQEHERNCPKRPKR